MPWRLAENIISAAPGRLGVEEGATFAAGGVQPAHLSLMASRRKSSGPALWPSSSIMESESSAQSVARRGSAALQLHHRSAYQKISKAYITREGGYRHRAAGH